MTRQFQLNLFIHGRSHHESAWRYTGASTLPLTDINTVVDFARKAEAGPWEPALDQLERWDPA